jgi:hypothetical protein
MLPFKHIVLPLKLEKKCKRSKGTYKWEEILVLTPLPIVIAYVLSHKSYRNSSNALAEIMNIRGRHR